MTDLTPRQLIDTIVRGLHEIGERFATKDQEALHDRIVRDPAIMQGKPVIRGTRISVELILRKLGAGLTPTEIIQDHPRLTESDIRAAQAYAAELVADEQVAPS